MSIKSVFMKSRPLLAVAVLIAAGYGLWEWGHSSGFESGEDYGRYAQTEYKSLKMSAQTCNDFADYYDQLPEAEKLKRGEPVKLDRTNCQQLVQLAETYHSKFKYRIGYE